MINEFRIFYPEEMNLLKAIEKETPDYFGFVYLVEYGNYLKIGQTKNIYQRMKDLQRQSVKYADMDFGRIAISPMCTNYRTLEFKFHEYFADCRKKGSELFKIGFSNAIERVLETNFEYLDESKELEEKEEQIFKGFKKFILSGYDLERSN